MEEMLKEMKKLLIGWPQDEWDQGYNEGIKVCVQFIKKYHNDDTDDRK